MPHARQVRFVNRKCGLLEELVHVPGMIEHPHDAATADSTSLPVRKPLYTLNPKP